MWCFVCSSAGTAPRLLIFSGAHGMDFISTTFDPQEMSVREMSYSEGNSKFSHSVVSPHVLAVTRLCTARAGIHGSRTLGTTWQLACGASCR